MTLAVLRSTGQVFYKISLDWNSSDIFLIIRLCQWVLRRKIIETKCHYHHIKSSIHSVNTATAVNFDHLSEEGHVRYLYRKVIPCPLQNAAFGRKCTIHTARGKNYTPYPGGQSNHSKFCTSIYFPLFISSFIYINIDSWALFNTWNYDPIWICLICCSNYLSFGNLFSWILYFFNIPQSLDHIVLAIAGFY